jgi:hypothetical protein
MRDIQLNRPTLGQFMSVVCFRYLNDDAQELAGPAMIIDAGRQRGQDVIEGLGVAGSKQDSDAILKELDGALGVDGTRLCLIKSIKEIDGVYEVVITEYPCVSYTMGVLIGAIGAINGIRMHGKVTSETDSECTYQIEPV